MITNPLDEFDNPIDKIAYLSGCYRAKHIDPRPGGLDGYVINDATLDEFANRIVKETISEMIQQMWNYGIDEANNPSFYKAIDATKKNLGVE